MRLTSLAGVAFTLICTAAFLGCSADDTDGDGGTGASAPADSAAAPFVADAAALSSRVDRLESLFAGFPPGILQALQVDTTGAAAWADSMAFALTLRQQIGQLIVADFGDPVGARVPRSITVAIDDFGVGGVLIPRTMQPDDLRRAVVEMQEKSAVPLFIAADYERGVGRFSNALTELPSNMTIGATGDTLFAAAAGRVTAIESRAIGVNLVFAPVVDVNRERLNPIVNIRAYGDDAVAVARYASSFSSEAEHWGLLTTFKHFPGHGNTTTDSHASLAIARGTLPEFEQHDIAPYEYAVRLGRPPSAVMVGHVWVPAVDEHPLAATFSRRLIGGYLRERIGFDGLVFSDDIRMRAVSADYTLAERVLSSLLAGVDVVVTPHDVEAAIIAIERAVVLGHLERRRVEESARRVLRAKSLAGLHNERVAPALVYDFLKENPVGQAIADSIAGASITRYAGSDSLLWPDAMSVVHLANFPEAESIIAAMDSVDAWLDVTTSIRSSSDMTDAGREILAEQLSKSGADAVLVVLYQRLRVGRGSAGLLEGHRLFVRDVLRLSKSVHILNVGNPYELPEFSEAASILVGYDQTIATMRAAIAAGRSGASLPGNLPVDLEQ